MRENTLEKVELFRKKFNELEGLLQIEFGLSPKFLDDFCKVGREVLGILVLGDKD